MKDDTTTERYGFKFDPNGPQAAGEDVVPSLLRETDVTPGMVLWTEQKEMSTEAVAHYRAGGDPIVTLTMCGEGELRPIVVTWEGRDWIIDGHHRIAASRANGEPSIRAWHEDVPW